MTTTEQRIKALEQRMDMTPSQSVFYTALDVALHWLSQDEFAEIKVYLHSGYSSEDLVAGLVPFCYERPIYLLMRLIQAAKERFGLDAAAVADVRQKVDRWAEHRLEVTQWTQT